MAQRHTHWPQGTPCWADLMVGDIERSAAFYGAVLGWTFPGGLDAGYVIAQIGDLRVAALCPGAEDDEPCAWSVYLSADDLDEVILDVVAAGGEAVAPASDIGIEGRMSTWLDDQGSVTGGWQSGRRVGFEVYDEPGALAWAALLVPDVARAVTFYTHVFDYHWELLDAAGDRAWRFTPLAAHHPAGYVGGLGDAGDPWWLLTWSVAHLDVAVRQAIAHGGTVLRTAGDGTGVLVSGPDGETIELVTTPRW